MLKKGGDHKLGDKKNNSIIKGSNLGKDDDGREVF
jgi:hypothetical protein